MNSFSKTFIACAIASTSLFSATSFAEQSNQQRTVIDVTGKTQVEVPQGKWIFVAKNSIAKKKKHKKKSTAKATKSVSTQISTSYSYIAQNVTMYSSDSISQGIVNVVADDSRVQAKITTLGAEFTCPMVSDIGENADALAEVGVVQQFTMELDCLKKDQTDGKAFIVVAEGNFKKIEDNKIEVEITDVRDNSSAPSESASK